MTLQTDDTIKLLIADDHAMVLEMLQMYLRDVPDIVVSTAPDLPQALTLIAEQGPFDLALLDLNMPGMNGLAGLERALEANGGMPVGVLTSAPQPKVVEEIVRIGGAGIVLKSASLKNFSNEIRFMAGGARYLPIELVEQRKPTSAPGAQGENAANLSKREHEVLAYLSEGKLNREIGAALSLAEPTVKMHVKSICKKLGVNTRTQAVIAARDRQLI